MSLQGSWSQEELDEALIAAVEADDVGAAKAWLDMGADADARASVHDRLLLCVAVDDQKRPDLVRLLAARTKHINLPNSCDFTVFTQAVRLNLPEIAGILLDCGADPFPSGLGRDYPLDWAVTHNLCPLVGRMLSEGECPDRPFKQHDTLLLMAARTNNLDLARACLDAGAAVDLAEWQSGATALHIAAKSGRTDLIALLLEHGADTALQDNARRTPCDWAQNAGNSTVMTRLLTARHMQQTAREMTEGTVQPVTVGAPLKLVKPAKRIPAMKFVNELMIKAIQQNETGELKKLLDGDIPPDEFDERGRTPLHWAVWKNNLRAAEMLVDHAAPLDARDNIGATPLHWAVRKNLQGIAELLTAAGASADIPTLKSGLTSLHIAAKEGQPGILLLLAGVAKNVDARTPEGETALMLAAERNNADAVRILLEAGASPDASDNAGRTALHRAKAAGADEVSGLLASRSAAAEFRGGTKGSMTVGPPLKLKHGRS